MTNREELETLLGSGDPEVRRQAAARLSHAALPEAVPLVLRALGDADWRVRKEATAVVLQMPASRDLLTALVGTFQPSDNVGLRNAAVEALAGFGAASIDAVAAALPTLDADGRKLAAEALAKVGHASGLHVLRGLLGDPDVNVRIAAIEAIGAIGSTCAEQAVPLLEPSLLQSELLVRLAALDGLNRLGAALAWETVMPLLADPILCRPALGAAGRSGHPEAALAITAMLERAGGSTWSAALAAMAEFVRSREDQLEAARAALAHLSAASRQRLIHQAGPLADSVEARRNALLVAGALRGQEATTAAVDALGDDRVAAEAEEALAMQGAEAVPTLASRAIESSQDERAACLTLLGRLADASTWSLVARAINAGLADDSPDIVRAALGAVARLGGADCLPAVAGWLGGELTVRKAAEAALAALAQRHPDAAREFARGAPPEGAAGHAAAIIMSSLGGAVRGPAEDIEFLSSVLSNESAPARRAAVEALAELSDARAVESVAFAIADEEHEVRLASVRALGRMRFADGAAAGLGPLLELVQSSQDAALVAAAIRALGDTAEPEALEVLRRQARAGDPMAAVAAVEALGQEPGGARWEGVLDALSHPEPEVVKAALRCLPLDGPAQAFAAVLECLTHPAWDVRRLAADLLGRSRAATAVDVLRSRLVQEAEPLVREAIVRALSELEVTGSVRRSTTPPPRRGSWPPR